MAEFLSMIAKRFLAAPNALAMDEKCGAALPIEKAIQKKQLL
jgi:hypothetical protein